MADEHIGALADLAAERDTPQLATMDEIKALGKKKIFKDANYPYPTKMKRAEYEEIKKLIGSYIKSWCPKKKPDSLAIAEHDRFLKESEEMFNLILQRIQDETERLYPMIKELSGDMEKAA